MNEQQAISHREVYPLDAPGMPLPGLDYLEMAETLGEDVVLSGRGNNSTLTEFGPRLEGLIRNSLYGGGDFRINLTVDPSKKLLLNVLCGHLWGCRQSDVGPARADVMIVGKMLGDLEVNKLRCMLGPSGRYFADVLTNMGIETDELRTWYLTNALPTVHPDGGGNRFRQSWVKNFRHLFHQQLRIVRPKYILCLGADAAKAVLGRTYTLSRMTGQVVDLEFPVHRSEDESENIHTAQVMAVMHPAAVLRDPDTEAKFEQTLARFRQLTLGTRWDKEEEGLDHRVITTEEGLIALGVDVRRECKDRLIAVDAEWHKEHPQNPGAYLRTIQISWGHKKAACIVLRNAGGSPGFDTGEKRAIKILGKILKGKRIAGHFFNADLEWLVYHGLDLRESFQAPEDWRDCATQGGLDTALMAHAFDETGEFGLTAQTLRYTEAPRYDLALGKWKQEFCKEQGIKAKDLDGYGDCPADVLYPYANYDADVTRRIAIAHMKNLTEDVNGENCWESFWVSQRAVLPVLEINTTGIPMDKDCVDTLTSAYIQVKNDLEHRIRTWANWPALNLNSVFQVREFLFGEEYNGKADLTTSEPIRLRPEEARSIATLPVLTTGLRPKSWDEVVAAGEEHEHAPATNKSVMALLVMEADNLRVRRDGEWVHEDMSEIIGWVRDYRIVARVLQSVLRMPKTDEETNEYLVDSDGNWVYSGGLAGSICGDGRIRTTIYQTKETGRWSSARPPLQNISKSREGEYARILGDKYTLPLRSVLCAPEGQVIIEADYVGAELFGMAIMSGDPQMISHAQRNQLDESDPDYLDMHSSVAALSFNLDCPPTKQGLADVGASHLRMAAKSVIFGVAYGRGARAIAAQSKELGFEINEIEAQKIIDTLYNTYPGLSSLFLQCRDRVTGNGAVGWMCNAFGRYRRFPPTSDRKILGEFERQAMNFPIQSMIADTVSRAVDHLYMYRQELRDNGVGPDELDYRLCLQIHDQVNLLAPAAHAERIIEEVLPECMVRRVPLYPTDMGGMPLAGRGPYFLAIDSDLCTRWGVKITKVECEGLGINPKYGK